MTRFKINLSFKKINGELILGDDKRLQIESGTAGTWILTFTLTNGELVIGESVVLRRYCFQAAQRLQNSHPERRDYVTFETSADAKVELQLPPWDIKGLVLKVTKGKLIPGDEIRIKIGDISGGSVGNEVFWSATRGRLELTTNNHEKIEKISDDYYKDQKKRPERLLAS